MILAISKVEMLSYMDIRSAVGKVFGIEKMEESGIRE